VFINLEIARQIISLIQGLNGQFSLVAFGELEHGKMFLSLEEQIVFLGKVP
jgi:hypothetical protein